MSVVLWCAALAAQGVSFWVLYRIWKAVFRPAGPVPARAPLPRSREGAIPVRATFTGLRSLPWVALATNSLHPVLRIEARQLVYRVLRLQQRPFTDILQVDVREAPGTVNLVFEFHATRFTFIANVGSVARAAQALALLPPAVPLSERARALLREPAA